MNENPQSSTRNWCSLAEAAVQLSVSEKTLRRRIKAGEIEAEKVPIEGGGLAWRVHLESNALDNVPEAQWPNATHVPEVVPEAQRTMIERESSALDTRTQTQRPNAPEGSDTRARSRAGHNQSGDNSELIELLRERLALADARERQMNLQIEAANQQAATATAALREYLKVQAKALPSGEAQGESSTRNETVVSRRDASQQPQNASMSQEPPNIKNAAQSGLRGEGLRDLRTIFRKILGIG